MAVTYDFVFLTPVEVKKEELEEIFSELEKQIKSIDGKVKNKKGLGKKSLAYQIKENSQANFWVWSLEFDEGRKFDLLNTYLNRSEIVIRYLFLLKSE